jgi:hypothetical protein
MLISNRAPRRISFRSETQQAASVRNVPPLPPLAKVVNFPLMLRSQEPFLFALCALAACIAAPQARAQLVASRDLTTGSRVPAEHLSVPDSCQKTDSSIDSDLSPPQSGTVSQTKDLELTITALSPAKLTVGEDFTATLRLKNVASGAVLVPAVPDGERVLRTSSDGSEEKYEVGDVSFRLVSGKPRSIPVFLDSGGALFADPDDTKSYLSLAPGNWMEIKIHGAVECGLEHCVSDIHPDDKAVLTAWWYERVLTHRIHGCEETHGSQKVRELDSAPFPVVVVEAARKKSSVMAWKH